MNTGSVVVFLFLVTLSFQMTNSIASPRRDRMDVAVDSTEHKARAYSPKELAHAGTSTGNRQQGAKPTGVEFRLPLVINTWAFTDATKAATESLLAGDRSLDALVQGCKRCEDLKCDGTVGPGGSPDENGESTVEGMIMNGETMEVGSVATMRNIKSPIELAYAVMKHTEVTILADQGATAFAEAMGYVKEDLHSEESIRLYKEWKSNRCQPNYWKNVVPDSKSSCGPYAPSTKPHLAAGMKGSRASRKSAVRDAISFKNHDTIGMITVDSDGHIAAGTSTNGASHRIMGRVGDSPLPGSGAYANDYGACAATGDGDIMLRFVPCYQAVESVRMGMDPFEAAMDALARIGKKYSNFKGGLVVVDKIRRTFGAAGHGWGRPFPFSVWHGGMKEAGVTPQVWTAPDASDFD
eukprot:Nk52_evm74s1073 gene=Nk52_evmTU74s1073